MQKQVLFWAFAALILTSTAVVAQTTLPESTVKPVMPKQVPMLEDMPAPLPGDMAQRQALVKQYVNPQRYDQLYQTVIDQYISMAPNNNNAQSLKEDPAFRDQIFGLVQQRASKTFTLDELQAMQKFVDSPEGGSISRKVNALGLQFRTKELDEKERAALNAFSQSPQGKSIAGKSVSFASGSLGEVMRSVLVRQAMSGGL